MLTAVVSTWTAATMAVVMWASLRATVARRRAASARPTAHAANSLADRVSAGSDGQPRVSVEHGVSDVHRVRGDCEESDGRRRATPRHAGRVNVLLLRPCAGAEPSLAECLASSSAAGVGTRIRFLVASHADGAYPVAARVAGQLAEQGHDAIVVVTHSFATCAPARGQRNRKVAQLAAAIEEDDVTNGAPSGDDVVVVVADSDVLVDAPTFDALLDPLSPSTRRAGTPTRVVPEAGTDSVANRDGRADHDARDERDERDGCGVRRGADAAWAPPVEVRLRTFGDCVSATILGRSFQAFPLLKYLDRHTMVGKLFAIRRSALQAVGGMETLGAHLGEDMELGRRLRISRMRVVAIDAPVPSLATGRSLSDVLARYARWITVVRAQRPWLLASYPLLFAAFPLQLVMAGIGAARGEAHASLAIVFAIATRVAVAVGAERLGRSISRLDPAPDRASTPMNGEAPAIAPNAETSSTAPSGLQSRTRWRSPASSSVSPALSATVHGVVAATTSLILLVAADVVLLIAFFRAIVARTFRWRGATFRIDRQGLLEEVP